MCWKPTITKFEKWSRYCSDTEGTRDINDLFNPLRLYGENFKKGFCVVIDNSPDNKISFTDYFINNSTDFDNAIIKYKEPTGLYNNSFLNNTIPKLYELSLKDLTSFLGYNVGDPIFREDKLFMQTMKIPISDPYGKCKPGKDMVRYLKNKKTTCSYRLNMNNDYCNAFNDNILLRNLSSYISDYDNITSTVIKTDPIINIYYVVDKLYYLQTSRSSLLSSLNFVSTGCQCSNILKRIKINFLMTNATIDNIEIDYFVEDVRNTCGGTIYIPVTYEVEFKGNNKVTILFKKTDINTKSGNPGYIKGKPLIIAEQGKTSKVNILSGYSLEEVYVKQYKVLLNQ